MSNNSTHTVIPSFFLCTLTILLQIVIMGLFDSYSVALTICGFIVLIICYSLVTYHRDYSVVFTYTFVLTVLSTITLYMLLLFKQNYNLSLNSNEIVDPNIVVKWLVRLPYDSDNLSLGFNFYVLITLNCVIPFITGIIICLFDLHDRYHYFSKFFVHHSILILLIYSMILIYMVFIKKGMYKVETNVIPFMTIATYIEDVILEERSVYEVIKYIIYNTIIYLPYGFYMGLLIKGTNKLFKLFVLTVLPLIIETTRLLLLQGVFDIDHILLAIIGGVVGIIIFNILNFTFVTLKEEEFLEDSSNPSLYYSFRE